MLKHILTVTCVAALLFVAGPAGVVRAESDATRLYTAKCKLCHGVAGRPSAPFAERGVKDLADPEWQDANSDDQIKDVIADGVEDTLMRAFGEELKTAQMDSLVAFIRGLRRK